MKDIKMQYPQYSLDHQELVDCIKKYEATNTNFYFLGNYIKGVSVSDSCFKFIRANQ